MLRSAMNVSPDEKVDEIPNYEEPVATEKSNAEEEVNADETESNKDVIFFNFSTIYIRIYYNLFFLIL